MMIDETPSISVVMPCYNAEAHLEQSLKSLKAQTYSNWELIAVNDGSIDSTWDLLKQAAQGDARIHALNQQNTGAAKARNHGLTKARGEYIAFLDADDTWHPEFLSEMLSTIEKHPNTGIAYCGWQNIGLPGGQGEPHIPPNYETDNKLEVLLRDCPWPIHGALIKAGLIHQAKGFDENLSSCMDFDLWLRIATATDLVRIPRVLAYYHHHDNDERITKNITRIAFNHWKVQRKYIASHPAVQVLLSRQRIRAITHGELLHRGYQSYWARDLEAARNIFRRVMHQAYGRPKDWLYMLPSLLPLRLHQWLVDKVDRTSLS